MLSIIKNENDNLNMELKTSYFITNNQNFAIGQKFINVRAGNKTYSFPIFNNEPYTTNSSSFNSTITIPIPFDSDDHYLQFIMDFILCTNQNQIVQFQDQYNNGIGMNVQVGVDNSYGEYYTKIPNEQRQAGWLQYDSYGYGRNYYRISMDNENQRKYMRVYKSNGTFANIEYNYVTTEDYGQNIVFTLNQQLIPNYQPGQTYYARYTWIDSTYYSYTDWQGFKFTGDVIQIAQPQKKLQKQIVIYDNYIYDSTTPLDFYFGNGEIQTLTITQATSIDIDKFWDIPIGKSIKLIIDNNQSYTVTLINDSQSVQLTYNKILLQVTNIGSKLIMSYSQII